MNVSRVLFFAWVLTACVSPEIPEIVKIEEPAIVPTANLDGKWVVKFADGGTANLSLLGGETLNGSLKIDKFVFRPVYGTATTDTYELTVYADLLTATGAYAVAGTSFTLITAKTRAEGAFFVDDIGAKTNAINGVWNIGDGSLGKVRWAQAGSVLLGGSDNDAVPVIVGVVKPDGSFSAEHTTSDPKGYYQGTFNADRTVATVNVTTSTLSLDVVYTRIAD